MPLKAYRVSWGEHSQVVAGENEDMAKAAFDKKMHFREPRLVSSPEENEYKVEDLGFADQPRKKLYRVSWGDMTQEVQAVHEADAWAQFSGGHEFAHPEIRRNPGLYPRIIEDLGFVDEQDNGPREGQEPKDTRIIPSDFDAGAGTSGPVPAGGLGGAPAGQGAAPQRAGGQGAPTPQVPRP